MSPPRSTLVRAAALGFVAGLRAVTPLAALHLCRNAVPGALGRLLVASAAAEIAVDKLPWTPSRLSPIALAARLASGGMAGHAVAGRQGIAPGAAAASAGAYLGRSVRRRLIEVTGWPDFRGALAEDVIAVTIAGVTARRTARAVDVRR